MSENFVVEVEQLEGFDETGRIEFLHHGILSNAQVQLIAVEHEPMIDRIADEMNARSHDEHGHQNGEQTLVDLSRTLRDEPLQDERRDNVVDHVKVVAHTRQIQREPVERKNEHGNRPAKVENPVLDGEQQPEMPVELLDVRLIRTAIGHSFAFDCAPVFSSVEMMILKHRLLVSLSLSLASYFNTRFE